MEFRRLGNSGLSVSEIGIGCNNFGVRIDQAQRKLILLDKGGFEMMRFSRMD